MADPTVKVGVFADASQLKRELDKAQGQVSGFADSAKKSGSLFREALFGTAVIYGATRLIQAGNEVVKVNKETERVLTTTGAAAWSSKDQISAMANSLSKLSGVDDEVIQSGENLLLTFTQVKNSAGEGNDVFDRGTKAALDMSAALGTDLNSSVLQLGKALNEPISGMTALRRVGVSLTEDQKNLIGELTRSGDLLGAQKVILAEVEREFGGAAATAKTPLDELKVSLGNLEESLGGALLPAFNALAGFVTTLADAFAKLPQPLQTAVLGLGAAAYVGPKLAGAMSGVVGALKKLPEAFDRAAMKAYDAAGSFDNFTSKHAKLLDGLAGAGVVVAGAVAAWQIYQSAIHSTDQQIQDMVGSIRDSAKSGSYEELTAKIEGLRAKSAELDQERANSKNPFDADYRDQLIQGANALDRLREELSGTAVVIKSVSMATGDSEDKVYDWIRAQEQAGITYSDSGTAIAAYTGEIKNNGLTTDQAKQAQQGFAESIRDVIKAQQEAVDPFFAAVEAQKRLQEAQQASYLTSLDQSAGTDKQTESALAATQAAVDYDSKLLTLAASAEVAGGGIDGVRSYFDKLVQQGLVTREDADRTIAKFQEVGTQADQNLHDRGFRVTADTSQATGAVDDLKRRIVEMGNAAAASNPVFTAGDVSRFLDGNRAGGGAVEPWSAYRVHDTSAPELLTMSDGTSMLLTGANSGYVTNLADSAYMSASNGGGGVVAPAVAPVTKIAELHLHGVDNFDDFVEKFRRWERSNGAVSQR